MSQPGSRSPVQFLFRLASVRRTASFTFAGVLALATMVSGFAAALALAGIFAFARVGTFTLILIGQRLERSTRSYG